MTTRQLRTGLPVQTRSAREQETAPNGEPFHVRIRASTEAVARDGGVVPMAAWENGGLEPFSQNPIILFAHQARRLPVARAVHFEINRDSRSLIQWWEFHEETELSSQLKELYGRGFMRAASVAFRVLEFAKPSEEEEILAGLGIDPEGVQWVAKDAELLETSAVNVGADPEALAVDHALQKADLRHLQTGAVRDELENLRRRCEAGDADACRRLPDNEIRIEVRKGESRREALDRWMDRFLQLGGR